MAAATLKLTLDLYEAGQMGVENALRGIAAAEAVAHALGRPSPEGEEVLAGAPTATLDASGPVVGDAGQVLRAVAAANSPLRAIWDAADRDALEAWMATLTDLRARLEGAGTVAQTQAAAPQASAPRDDIGASIARLEAEVAQLRAEMNDNFARLAARLGGVR